MMVGMEINILGVVAAQCRDDFNFFKGCLYKDEFIPPTEYIGGKDVLSNYYDNDVSNIANLEPEFVDNIEKHREHSISYINERERGFLPKRARFNWHEEHKGYFRGETGYYMISRTNTNTHINVEGVDQPFLSNYRFFEGNLEVALDAGKVLPMMIFINGKFMRLSQIKIVKSYDYYCFIFHDRNRFTEGPVTSFEIIVLPFPVIYEEDYGERADRSPLYTFSRDGKFDPVNGNTFYYIDQERLPNLKHIGIREQVYPNDTYLKNKTETEKAELANQSLMKFSWRFGTLEARRLDEDGNGAYMTFRSDDYSWVKPGDNVMLYNGTTLIDPSLYEIVGYDLIYFEDLEKARINYNRTITMQVITDSQNPKDNMLFQDLTDLKLVTVEATVHNQSVFKIPDISDGDGIEWRKFLLFKGHVLMENDKRYTIDYDEGTIRLNDPKDFMPKGRHLLFAFLKIKKSDSRGNLYVKPLIFYHHPTNGIFSTIPVPENYIEPTQDNIMVFRNGTFISPNRYKIVGRQLEMNEDEPHFSDNTSLVFIMLKIISPFDDPSGWRENMIIREYEQGNRFVLYDLNIPKKVKITLDNFLCFDENGELITDLKGHVYDLNIVKKLSTFKPLERHVRYLTCLYRTDFLENEDNALLPTNDTFMREYIKGKQEYYEMDEHFDEFMNEFNFNHRKDLTYGENLSRSLNYILSYNQNKFDDIYDQRATASRRVYNTLGLNQSMTRTGEGQWELTIPRGNYRKNASMTYPIFFQDGKLADWNSTFRGDNNDIKLTLPSKLPADAKIESIDFHNMSNFLYPLESIVKSDKRASLQFPVHLISGQEYGKEFDASLSISREWFKDLNASIEIPEYFNYQEAKNDYGIDLFPASIHVICDYEKWFSAFISIVNDLEGIEVDLDSFNMGYDFSVRIEVKENIE